MGFQGWCNAKLPTEDGLRRALLLAVRPGTNSQIFGFCLKLCSLGQRAVFDPISAES
jgi:hypothetical protein